MKTSARIAWTFLSLLIVDDAAKFVWSDLKRQSEKQGITLQMCLWNRGDQLPLRRVRVAHFVLEQAGASELEIGSASDLADYLGAKTGLVFWMIFHCGADSYLVVTTPDLRRVTGALVWRDAVLER